MPYKESTNSAHDTELSARPRGLLRARRWMGSWKEHRENRSNDTRNMPTVVLNTVGLCTTTRKLLAVVEMVVIVVFIFTLICIWQVELTP